MKQYIFLDIDGVLNTPDDWIQAKYLPSTFNPTNATTNIMNQTKVALLKFLVETTYAQIVLTSTWRLLDNGYQETIDKMVLCGWEDAGDWFIDETGISYHRDRDTEVLEWLEINDPYTSKFVILDDISPAHWHPNLQKHLVHVDNTIGLRIQDIEKAVRILG